MRDEGITYEVALEPDAEILPDFEAWLEYHVDEMLALPGFTGASIHKAEDPDSGAALRVVRYQLTDRAALERYLDEFAPRMRAEGLARFGGRFRASRRVVLEGRDAALTDARPCPNCSELLWGQYCASCGQRARTRMITFWELLKDAGDLLASLDSRLWKTLGLLMFRPGRLTLDYLQGKRARFVPPARLFIASSIVFFFIATLSARLDFDTGTPLIIDADTELGEAERPASMPRAGPEPGAEPGAEPAESGGRRATITTGPGMNISFDRDCNVDYSGAPDWLVRLVPPERAVEICRRITVDRGRSFATTLLSNVPAMMFLFLPIMALVMKLAYPLSGRYYAEHLLFLVHFHSFFFFINILLALAFWGVEAGAPDHPAITWLAIAAYVYIPIYLFRAMRVVYGQGFWTTSFKYIVLGLAYMLSLVATFIGLLVYTAVTL
jgi:hypothetical protein